MGYKSLESCILDLEKNGELVRIREEVDPDLEMAEIHRRVNQAQGPAIFYEKVKGCKFPAVSNLFGTFSRTQFIFRDTLKQIKKIFQIKGNPPAFFKKPFAYTDVPWALVHALPKKVSGGPVFYGTAKVSDLPQIRSWPRDGGPFILLPQVYTEDPDRPGIMGSNLGMYRVQLAGNEYEPDAEVGLHYQIRRDIGIHHSHALRAKERLRVSVFVGGPPAHTFSAVMYLPENLAEVTFAGLLGGRRFRYAHRDGFTISTDADFCLTGYVEPTQTKPEGPFGDHLGYYSLQHEFPCMRVERVYHRKNAIWPFTVVGRPPQEDSSLGKLVQEIAGPVIPQAIPGVKAVHAVDACGVHPLLLAVGSERYQPYRKRKPQELLTLANAILGYGPCSLAKYLLIMDAEDDPRMDIHDVRRFFMHILERVDWSVDLHFQTRTTIDTLDYSGTGLHEGSKVFIAVCGKPRRQLATEIPSDIRLPNGFRRPVMALPGVLVLTSPKFSDYENSSAEMSTLSRQLSHGPDLSGIALIVVADDSEFCGTSLNNFLWSTFTRSNPSHDIYGVDPFTEYKHWGCRGPLIIDARVKPHHADSLSPDPSVARRVEELAVEGKSLSGVI